MGRRARRSDWTPNRGRGHARVLRRSASSLSPPVVASLGAWPLTYRSISPLFAGRPEPGSLAQLRSLIQRLHGWTIPRSVHTSCLLPTPDYVSASRSRFPDRSFPETVMGQLNAMSAEEFPMSTRYWPGSTCHPGARRPGDERDRRGPARRCSTSSRSACPGSH